MLQGGHRTAEGFERIKARKYTMYANITDFTMPKVHVYQISPSRALASTVLCFPNFGSS